MRIFAHRGASRHETENTVAAFRAAVAMGADGVELDVRVDLDGDLVVHHDDHLADDRVGADRVFERGRGDVLAAGRHDDLLLATGDFEEALLVEGADVAGLEPVAVECLGRRLGVAPVLLEDVDAAHLDLVVFAETDADT